MTLSAEKRPFLNKKSNFGTKNYHFRIKECYLNFIFSVYLFGYLYMCLICVSYTRELNVSRFSKEVKISGKNRRIAAQIPSYDDIQSNTTYMERLSDMVRKNTGILPVFRKKI